MISFSTSNTTSSPFSNRKPIFLLKELVNQQVLSVIPFRVNILYKTTPAQFFLRASLLRKQILHHAKVVDPTLSTTRKVDARRKVDHQNAIAAVFATSRLRRIQGYDQIMHSIVCETQGLSIYSNNTAARTLSSVAYVEHHSCGVLGLGRHTTGLIDCIAGQKADKRERMAKRTSLPQTTPFTGMGALSVGREKRRTRFVLRVRRTRLLSKECVSTPCKYEAR